MTIEIILFSILFSAFAGLLVFGLVYIASQDDRYIKRRIKEILMNYIRDEKMIDLFIKKINFNNEIEFYTYNERIDYLELNDKLKEEYLIESFYFVMFDKIILKHPLKFDLLLNKRMISKKINDVFNVVNKLVLEYQIKEEERDRLIFGMCGKVFYKETTDRFIKDLFLMK